MHGVTFEDVGHAYRFIRGKEKLQTRRVGYRMREHYAPFEDIVNEIATALGGSRDAGHGHRKETSLEEAPIPVIANNTDAEAVSTCQVLAVMIQMQTQKLTQPVFHISDFSENTKAPSHTVILLTPGSLTAQAWSEMVLHARLQWPRSELCCMRVPEFQFPAKEHLEGEIYPQVAKSLGVDVSEVGSIYRDVTAVLAFAFIPAEHINVMTVQARKLTNKIRLSQGGVVCKSTESRKVAVVGALADEDAAPKPKDEASPSLLSPAAEISRDSSSTRLHSQSQASIEVTAESSPTSSLALVPSKDKRDLEANWPQAHSKDGRTLFKL